MKKCNDLNNDVSEAALTRAAREAVAGALAGDFPIDPLIWRRAHRFSDSTFISGLWPSPASS